MSQHARPRIEPAFGWLKTIAWTAQGEAARTAQRGLGLRVRERRLQRDAVVEAAAEDRLMRATCLHVPVDGPRQTRTHPTGRAV